MIDQDRTDLKDQAEAAKNVVMALLEVLKELTTALQEEILVKRAGQDAKLESNITY